MSEEAILEKWNEVKATISALEEDVVKNLLKGNASAGVRARKGLRGLRGQLTVVVKQSMEIAKSKKVEKPHPAVSMFIFTTTRLKVEPISTPSLMSTVGGATLNTTLSSAKQLLPMLSPEVRPMLASTLQQSKQTMGQSTVKPSKNSFRLKVRLFVTAELGIPTAMRS